MTRTYETIAEIKDVNKDAGFYFFEPATMRFFNSKIASQTVFGGRYFITSEQFVGSDHVAQPRRYTLRVCHEDGSIDTVGDFQQYTTVAQARQAARALARFSYALP